MDRAAEAVLNTDSYAAFGGWIVAREQFVMTTFTDEERPCASPAGAVERSSVIVFAIAVAPSA